MIGRALTHRLLSDGHAVVAWVRDPERARAKLGPHVELVEARDDGSLAAALGGCNAVVNLAGENVIRRRRAGATHLRAKSVAMASVAGLAGLPNTGHVLPARSFGAMTSSGMIASVTYNHASSKLSLSSGTQGPT